MSVSAIVPVWNGREHLEQLLRTIERQTVPFAEVLIVDNGSTDGAPEKAESRGARVIRLGRNTGFAYAVNRGIENARHEWLAILNSDVLLDPRWLEELLRADAPIASGKILSIQDPAILDGTFDLLCRGACAWRAGNGKRDQDVFARGPDMRMASFTAVLARRGVFRRAGLLDERFESYLEDVDFGIRCALMGIGGAFVPEAVCRHHGSAAMGRWSSGTVRRISRNQVFLVARHYPRALILRWLWPIFVAQTLWGLVALRHGRGGAWVLGKWEGLRRFGSLRPRFTSEWDALRLLVLKQERRLYLLQRTVGMDWYWRIYFALVSHEAK